MSLLIKVRGADFSKLALPKLQETIFGFPADSLKGLFLLEDGAPGSLISSFVDSSGNGNHASVMDTWSIPQQMQSGVVTTDNNGMVIKTPIPANTSFSWVLVGRHLADASEGITGRFPTFIGQCDYIGTSSSNNLNAGLVLNVDLSNEPISETANSWGVYSPDIHGSRFYIPSSSFPGSNVSVLGVTLNIETGRVSIRNLSGQVLHQTALDLGNSIRKLDGTVCFGCWKHQNYNFVSGEVHLFAHYDAVLSDADLTKAMQAAKARVESRGVSVS